MTWLVMFGQTYVGWRIRRKGADHELDLSIFFLAVSTFWTAYGLARYQPDVTAGGLFAMAIWVLNCEYDVYRLRRRRAELREPVK